MTFTILPGKLLVDGISDETRGRYVSIELAILRKIGSLKHDPITDGASMLSFSHERTDDVIAVLKTFSITPEIV